MTSDEDLAPRLAATREMVRIITRALEIGARMGDAQTVEENDLDLAAILAVAEDMRDLIARSRHLFPALDAAQAERMIDDVIAEAKAEIGWL